MLSRSSQSSIQQSVETFSTGSCRMALVEKSETGLQDKSDQAPGIHARRERHRCPTGGWLTRPGRATTSTPGATLESWQQADEPGTVPLGRCGQAVAHRVEVWCESRQSDRGCLWPVCRELGGERCILAVRFQFRHGFIYSKRQQYVKSIG